MWPHQPIRYRLVDEFPSKMRDHSSEGSTNGARIELEREVHLFKPRSTDAQQIGTIDDLPKLDRQLSCHLSAREEVANEHEPNPRAAHPAAARPRTSSATASAISS